MPSQPITEYEIALMICTVIVLMSLLGMALVFLHAYVKSRDDRKRAEYLRFLSRNPAVPIPGAVYSVKINSKFGQRTQEAIDGANKPGHASAQVSCSVPVDVLPHPIDYPANLRTQADIWRVSP